MKKYKIHQLPVLGVWWLRRQSRYIGWSIFHHLCGPLKFKSIGSGVKFNGRVRVEQPFSEIYIGAASMIGVGCYFLARSPGFIKIGDNVGINDNCFITSCYGITIGDNVRIAENVSIRDYDHEFIRTDIPISKQGLKGAPIIIGKDSWIGRGVMITEGVKIGTGCIVGANAVVTKDLPDWSIAVGVPAKVIKSRK